jgi:general secretion pathway protein B
MSILLEALKKSEEQRQLGRAPNIHSPTHSRESGSEGGRQWIPVALMTVAVLAMAWIGWRQFQVPPQTEGRVTAEVDAGDAPSESAAANGAGQTETLAANDAAPAEGVAETAGASEPEAVAQAAPRTPVESFQAGTGRLQDAKATPSPDLQTAQRQKAKSKQSVKTFQSDAPAAERAAEPSDSVAASDAGPAVAEAANQAAPPRASQSAPHVSQPISYWELPQGVRDQLPEMHITVLVYADRPEDRFLLINGKRVLENEIYEPGVVLEEIRRDGAVFRYRTYRFMVEG